ncbi:ATP-binding cassette sub-family D member 4 [Toxocara canis]|uniref:ATP-binding cassette sub-family D member 4 n=1 Tax=Toxocara canis TaxID=6265 RepID=A0A0B2VMM9_TOXCA|nr:ATP-binding cassette sub-family D member 4 [Toxocara canis]
MSKLSLDRNLFRRIFILFAILFPVKRNGCPLTLQLAIVVFIVSAIDQLTTYYVGVLPSEFYVALGNRDLPLFRYLIGKSALIIFLKALTLAASKYSSSLLFIKCRQLCAQTLHQLYFKHHVYYQLTVSADALDNPDQRMTQDVEKLTRILTQDLFVPVIMAPFIVGYYTYRTYDSSGWVGPLAIYGYFASSTIVNKLILSPIVGLVNDQEKREGDLRSKHCEIRANVEAIAFYRSGATENTMVNSKLDALIDVQKKLIAWRTFLCLATSIFDYYGGTLSYLLIAIPIFLTHDFDGLTGTDLSGIVSKNVFFYLYLIYSFTRLVALAENFGDMAGVAHRVVGLYEELRRLNDSNAKVPRKESDSSVAVVTLSEKELDDEFDSRMKEREASKHEQTANESSSDTATAEQECLLSKKTDLLNGSIKAECSESNIAMVLSSLCIANPSNSDSVLLYELSMLISSGQNLLITGDSSSGKTSILRVLADLWKCSSGKVERFWEFSPSTMLFIPQNPYFPSGATTLRQQLVYPSIAEPNQKEIPQLKNILESIQMTHAIERFSGFDTPFDGDWQETLSRGELQRLCIGRVLYHRPKIVFLDECTSALGLKMEVSLYRIIKETGISFVSVGHRQSLRQFHDLELHLNGDGGWSVCKIDKEAGVQKQLNIHSTSETNEL